MATIDPYSGTDEVFTPSMWKEACANWRASGENVFNKRSGEASLIGYIRADNLKAAMRFMFGYEQVHEKEVVSYNAVDGFFVPELKFHRFVLRRKNPVRHPYYEQLWCNGCAEHEFKANKGARTDQSGLKVPTLPTVPKKPDAIPFRTGYERAKLMARFAPVACDILEDEEPGDNFPTTLSDGRQEWRRNCTFDWEPQVSTFETKVPWRFAEGVNVPAAFGTNPFGQNPQAEKAQILVRPDIKVLWEHVPADWLFLPETQQPTNLLNALGTVNDQEFLKCASGTLLFLGCKLTRNSWTLLPRSGLPGVSLESRFLYDVELLFSYFDPIKGFTGNPPVKITTFRGHNNFLYRGNLAALDSNGMRWFIATTNTTLGDNTLYRYSLFRRIFDCARNPDT